VVARNWHQPLHPNVEMLEKLIDYHDVVLLLMDESVSMVAYCFGSCEGQKYIYCLSLDSVILSCILT
jgi:hypothetical protein